MNNDGRYGTSFVETDALLAVMEDDDDEALRLLRGLHNGELRAFDKQLDRLQTLIFEVKCERES